MALRKFGRGTLKLLFVFVIIVMLIAVAINENIVCADSSYFSEELKRISPQVMDLPIPSTINPPTLPIMPIRQNLQSVSDISTVRVPGIERYLK